MKMTQERAESFRLKAMKAFQDHGLIYGLDFWWDDGLRVLGPATAKLVGSLLREHGIAGQMRWNEGKGSVASK
jgi:hypothetical protein